VEGLRNTTTNVTILFAVQGENRNGHLPNTNHKFKSLIELVRVHRNLLSSCGYKYMDGLTGTPVHCALNFMYLVQVTHQCKVLGSEKFCGVGLRWLLSAFAHLLSQEEVLNCSAFIWSPANADLLDVHHCDVHTPRPVPAIWISTAFRSTGRCGHASNPVWSWRVLNTGVCCAPLRINHMPVVCCAPLCVNHIPVVSWAPLCIDHMPGVSWSPLCIDHMPVVSWAPLCISHIPAVCSAPLCINHMLASFAGCEILSNMVIWSVTLLRK
jgi:hypothetical protein